MTGFQSGIPRVAEASTHRRLKSDEVAERALDALEQALHERRLDPENALVHHRDRGVRSGFKVSARRAPVPSIYSSASPMGRKSALRREIPWILRGFQGRLSC